MGSSMFPQEMLWFPDTAISGPCSKPAGSVNSFPSRLARAAGLLPVSDYLTRSETSSPRAGTPDDSPPPEDGLSCLAFHTVPRAVLLVP